MGIGPTRQPNLWQPPLNDTPGLQPVVRNSIIGTVMVDIGKTVPIRLRIYGGDDAAQTAQDFCLTYRKGPKARKMLMAAIEESIKFTETGNDNVDEDWVVVEDVHEVAVDLRRVQ